MTNSKPALETHHRYNTSVDNGFHLLNPQQLRFNALNSNFSEEKPKQQYQNQLSITVDHLSSQPRNLSVTQTRKTESTIQTSLNKNWEKKEQTESYAKETVIHQKIELLNHKNPPPKPNKTNSNSHNHPPMVK